MRLFEGLSQIQQKFNATALTIGNFDGVHLGHQELIRIVKSFGQRSVVMTFSPHPVRVLFPNKNLKKICTADQLSSQMESLGVETLVVEPFTLEFAQTPPENFLDQILKILNPQHVVVGYDFSFGADRKGSIDLLRQMGFNLNVVEALKIDGQVVSSNSVRQFLSDGNVERAQLFLGRPYEMVGRVIKGEGRGRQLGYPTANLKTFSELIPKTGVYITRVNSQYEGVTNVGYAPTVVERTEPLVEVHLFDYNQNLYDTDLRVEFLARIRDEKKFGSLDELKKQIAEDSNFARDHFAKLKK